MKVLEQLSKLHEFACHNDIKPQNIMLENDDYEGKKVSFDPELKLGHSKVYLIDYGGATREKLDNGFRRQIWTGAYTSQRPHSKMQFTCAKFDFIELIFTIQAIILWKRSKKDVSLGFFKSEIIQGGFEGHLHACMKIADHLPDDHDKAKMAWKDLYNILEAAYRKDRKE
jgi:serine/threonine protein kinase